VEEDSDGKNVVDKVDDESVSVLDKLETEVDKFRLTGGEVADRDGGNVVLRDEVGASTGVLRRALELAEGGASNVESIEDDTGGEALKLGSTEESDSVLFADIDERALVVDVDVKLDEGPDVGADVDESTGTGRVDSNGLDENVSERVVDTVETTGVLIPVEGTVEESVTSSLAVVGELMPVLSDPVGRGELRAGDVKLIEGSGIGVYGSSSDTVKPSLVGVDELRLSVKGPVDMGELRIGDDSLKDVGIGSPETVLLGISDGIIVGRVEETPGDVSLSTVVDVLVSMVVDPPGSVLLNVITVLDVVGMPSIDDDGNTGGLSLPDGTDAVVGSLGMVLEIVAVTSEGMLESGRDRLFDGTAGEVPVFVDEGNRPELLGLLDSPGTTGAILVSVPDGTGDGG
jgi:hypothetical protein